VPPSHLASLICPGCPDGGPKSRDIGGSAAGAAPARIGPVAAKRGFLWSTPRSLHLLCCDRALALPGQWRSSGSSHVLITQESAAQLPPSRITGTERDRGGTPLRAEWHVDPSRCTPAPGPVRQSASSSRPSAFNLILNVASSRFAVSASPRLGAGTEHENEGAAATWRQGQQTCRGFLGTGGNPGTGMGCRGALLPSLLGKYTACLGQASNARDLNPAMESRARARLKIRAALLEPQPNRRCTARLVEPPRPGPGARTTAPAPSARAARTPRTSSSAAAVMSRTPAGRPCCRRQCSSPPGPGWYSALATTPPSNGTVPRPRALRQRKATSGNGCRANSAGAGCAVWTELATDHRNRPLRRCGTMPAARSCPHAACQTAWAVALPTPKRRFIVPSEDPPALGSTTAASGPRAPICAHTSWANCVATSSIFCCVQALRTMPTAKPRGSTRKGGPLQ